MMYSPELEVLCVNIISWKGGVEERGDLKHTEIMSFFTYVNP